MSKLQEYFKNRFNAKRPSTFVTTVKRNKDGMLDELTTKTLFLDQAYAEPAVNQRLFHFINNIDHVLKCAYCQNPLQPKPYNARLVGEYYNGTCDNLECRKRLNSDNSIKGCLEKHGVVNISQTNEWREKVKKTNLERRGVEWNTQSIDLIDAVRASISENKEKINEKRRKTCIEKYGVNSFCETRKFKDAAINSSLEKYGVPHPMQNEKVFESRVYKRKPYTFPSGKVVQIQGYEWKCLDELLLNDYKEEDIVVGNVEISEKIGSICYEVNGKTHRYYPDIYIISENRIIEVKSTYTVKKDPQINNKKEAALKKGLKYSLKVY